MEPYLHRAVLLPGGRKDCISDLGESKVVASPSRHSLWGILWVPVCKNFLFIVYLISAHFPLPKIFRSCWVFINGCTNEAVLKFQNFNFLGSPQLPNTVMEENDRPSGYPLQEAGEFSYFTNNSMKFKTKISHMEISHENTYFN